VKLRHREKKQPTLGIMSIMATTRKEDAGWTPMSRRRTSRNCFSSLGLMMVVVVVVVIIGVAVISVAAQEDAHLCYPETLPTKFTSSLEGFGLLSGCSSDGNLVDPNLVSYSSGTLGKILIISVSTRIKFDSEIRSLILCECQASRLSIEPALCVDCWQLTVR